MVCLSQVHTSNSGISTALPAGLVAVFVGGTSGIGEISVKTFARYARKPRIYIVGRSQSAADRILAECKAINLDGEFLFLKTDVSLIHAVDELCIEIKAKEKSLNLLFLSAGVSAMVRAETAENLQLLAALNYYSRMRFIQNLLPLLQLAPSLRRVVTVSAGGWEGKLDTTDFQAARVPLADLREHLSTLITIGLEAVSRTAPEVSMVHDYPGSVKTPILNPLPEDIFKNLVFVPLEESGERHVYLATSARYPPPISSGSDAVPLGDEVDVAFSSTGDVGGGVYSVGVDCESLSPVTREKLVSLREKGLVEDVWRHTQEEFERITKLY